MGKIKNIIAITFAIIIVLFILGFTVTTDQTMPDKVVIYVDDINKVYYSPVYVKDYEIPLKNLRLTIYDGIIKKNYKPDSQCVNYGYFVQDERSLSGKILESIGILPKQQSRWTVNGDWNY